MPKLTAVVPVYNVEEYLGQLVESLLCQTLRDLQIVLVDDGSPDRSGAICDEYAAKDDRITVIHKPNGGVGAARNDGLFAAQGEWVYFCDSDDYLEPDALEKLVRVGEETGAEVVYGDVVMLSGERQQRMHFHKEAFFTDDRKVMDRLAMTVFGRNYCYLPPEGGPAASCFGGPWNKIVRRSLLEREALSFDLTVRGICDDLLYSIHLFAAAKSVAYVPTVIYYYRLLGNSITHSYKPALLEINQAIFQAWERFMERYGNQFREAYHVFVIRRLKATLGLYFFSKKNPKPMAQQFAELKALLDTEPYSSAIDCAEPDKLQNSYDRLLFRAAKSRSPRQIQWVFLLSVLAKKVKG